MTVDALQDAPAAAKPASTARPRPGRPATAGGATPFVLPAIDHQRLEDYSAALAAADDAIRVEAMNWFAPLLQTHYGWLLKAPRPQYEARIGAGDGMLRTLQDQGCLLARMAPELKARLSQATRAMAQELEAELDKRGKPRFRYSQVDLPRAGHPEIHALVEAAFAEAGLWEVVSAYVGDTAKLGSVVLQANTVHATRYRHGEIGPDGLPALRTDYFHMDSGGWPHLKVLVYLNEVGLDQGPFRYVPGSHRWTDVFEQAVRKAHDKHKTPIPLLMALPEPFRLLAHFGPYMDPDGPEAEALIAGEQVIWDEEGSDMVVFDFHGVHRGGFVRRGARHILQCNFAPADPEGPAARAAAMLPR